jgi:ribosomal protein S18 acetylase RimI-like enzyme
VPGSQEQIIAALGPYLLVAEANDEVIGFISGSIHSSERMAVMPDGESYLEIDDLYISPEFRRRGVGSGLVNQPLAQAKQQGVAYALLYSAAKDVRGILRFYEQHGFQRWYVRMFREL